MSQYISLYVFDVWGTPCISHWLQEVALLQIIIENYFHNVHVYDGGKGLTKLLTNTTDQENPRFNDS